MEHKLTFKDYNEALKQNKLLGLKCRECGSITTPPIFVCRKCSSTEMEVTQLTGKGTIQTFSTIYITSEGRESEVPYITTIVQLEEGPWTMGNLIGVNPEEASLDLIGKKVKMEKAAIYPGDKYSGGDMARPLFSLV